MQNLRFFKSSLYFTIIGLALGFYLGFRQEHSWGQGLQSLFIVFVLSILEISLSFDNAVVNASVLKRMTPIWQKRFLTWGILTAVFAVRLVLPVTLAAVLIQSNPWAALMLAIQHPHEYAEIMQSSHHMLAAFGGTFLFLVSANYFIDHQKITHWLHFVEKPLQWLGGWRWSAMVLSLILLSFFSFLIEPQIRNAFWISGIAGLLTYVIVNSLEHLFTTPGADEKPSHTLKKNLSLFMYLEVLDATFSLDGVIGAFAITHNIFVITLGLGIGALFVRSLTIMLVSAGTLSQLIYLEHGAFYAIGGLAAILYCDMLVHVPEVIAGFVGVTVTGLSIYSSIRYNNRNKT